MLQGDIHRFYLRLRRHWPTPPASPIDDLDHVRSIYDYYGQLPLHERRLLLAWAKKEESGIGLIPAALSGIPLLLLIFAPLIQDSLKVLDPWAWISLWFGGALLFTVGIYIHQRQKAYTTLHVQILDHLTQAEQAPRVPEGPDLTHGFPPHAH